MVDVDHTALFLVDFDHPALFYLVNIDATALFQPVDGRCLSTSVDVHFTALFITPNGKAITSTTKKIKV